MTVADQEEEVTPALFDHAKRVYDEMLKQSSVEYYYGEEMGWGRMGGDLEKLEIRTVYEGHLTRLFADLQIANPYYTKIVAALKGQGCIDQIRRGGGVALSKWQLNFPPGEDGFKAIMDRRRGPKGKAADIAQRVNDLTKTVNDLYGIVEALDEAFQKLYDDIQRSKG